MSSTDPSAYDKLEWDAEVFRDGELAEAMPAGKDIVDFQQDFYALSKGRRDSLLAILRLGGAANGLAVRDELEQLRNETRTVGAIYPTLDELVNKQLIIKEVNGRENQYSLTTHGVLTLKGGLAAFSQQ